MKIIGIVGSPHGMKGSTARLMMEVLNAAGREGAEIETVVLPGGTVLPCKGCDTCHRKGLCPQKDEFAEIKKKILDSDAVVLSSPNYIFSVSAQLKAFIDRCCGVIHCMEFEGKYGASVVTSGGDGEEPIADYMNQFLITTGIRPVGSVTAVMGAIQGPEFPVEIRNRAAALGKKLVEWHKNKTTSDETEQSMGAFRERMKQLMLWRRGEWEYEYEFWQNRGRF